MLITAPDETVETGHSARTHRAHEPAATKPDPALSAITLARIEPDTDLASPAVEITQAIRPDRLSLVSALRVTHALGGISTATVRALAQASPDPLALWRACQQGLTGWAEALGMDNAEATIRNQVKAALPLREIGHALISAVHAQRLSRDSVRASLRVLHDADAGPGTGSTQCLAQAVTDASRRIRDTFNEQVVSTRRDNGITDDFSDGDMLLHEPGDVLGDMGFDGAAMAVLEPTDMSYIPTPFGVEDAKTDPVAALVFEALSWIDWYLRPLVVPEQAFEFDECLFEEASCLAWSVVESLGVRELNDLTDCEVATLDEAIQHCDEPELMDGEDLQEQVSLLVAREAIGQCWIDARERMDNTLATGGVAHFAVKVAALTPQQRQRHPQLVAWLEHAGALISQITPETVYDMAPVLAQEMSLAITHGGTAGPLEKEATSGSIEVLGEMLQNGDHEPALIGWSMGFDRMDALAWRIGAASALIGHFVGISQKE